VLRDHYESNNEKSLLFLIYETLAPHIFPGKSYFFHPGICLSAMRASIKENRFRLMSPLIEYI